MHLRLLPAQIRHSGGFLMHPPEPKTQTPQAQTPKTQKPPAQRRLHVDFKARGFRSGTAVLVALTFASSLTSGCFHYPKIPKAQSPASLAPANLATTTTETPSPATAILAPKKPAPSLATNSQAGESSRRPPVTSSSQKDQLKREDRAERYAKLARIGLWVGGITGAVALGFGGVGLWSAQKIHKGYESGFAYPERQRWHRLGQRSNPIAISTAVLSLLILSGSAMIYGHQFTHCGPLAARWRKCTKPKSNVGMRRHHRATAGNSPGHSLEYSQ